jgi:hypothetical protein
MAWTFSATAGAAGAAAAGVAGAAAGAAGSSLPEQATSVVSRRAGANRRSLPLLMTYDIKHPLESTNVDCVCLDGGMVAAFPDAVPISSEARI